MMSEPVIAQKAPFAVEAEAQQKLMWCACGRSGKQPFCDGSHKDTGITPVAYTPQQNTTLHLCGCKHTGSVPLCDGSHNRLD